MSSPNRRSNSNALLLVIVFVLAALALFAPGAMVFHLGGLAPWGLFAPLGLMSVLHFALAVWVGLDAERRCGQGVLWGLLVFFTSIIGLIVYLIVRPGDDRRGVAEPRAARCPECGGAIESGFKVCPYCGRRLGGSCPGCNKPVRAEWRLCPECGATLGPPDSSGAVARSR